MSARERFAAACAALLLGVATISGAETRLTELAWLAGHWRGTLDNGAVFEAHYTDPTGGLIASVSKEVRNGRAVAFELETFREKEGRIIYHPHPNGKASEHAFPLVEYDGKSKRATFQNEEHDFPQRFVFELNTPDLLVITLSGPGKNGPRKEIVFRLQRAAR